MKKLKKMLSLMIVFSLVLAMMSGHKIKASEPLKIEKFEVEKSEVRCGEKIKLNIEISGAHKTYTIYEEDINGTKKTIVDNSYSSSLIWTPTDPGQKTLYLEVEDMSGNIVAASKEVNVKKGIIPDINRKLEYCYVTGDQYAGVDIVMCLMDYNIPDLADKNCKASVEELGDRKVITSIDNKFYYGCINFCVTDQGKIGDSAILHVTIKSKSYEDIHINYTITLKDQEEIFPDEESQPAIEGNDTLIYGQKLGELKLNSESAFFLPKGGMTYIDGTLKFENENEILPVGTQDAKYVFIPDNKEYKEYHGTVKVKIKKATPTLNDIKVGMIAYADKKTLDNVKLKTGKAVVMYDGKEKEISGNWKWKNPEQNLEVGSKKYSIIFTPDDTENYETVEGEVDVKGIAGPLKVYLKNNESIIKQLKDGDMVKEIAFVEKKINFVNEDGEKVNGTIQWEEPNKILTEGKQQVKYIFIPENKDYQSYNGTIEVLVNKEAPKIEEIKPEPIKVIKVKDENNVKVNQTTITNGITYKITKIVNKKNAEVKITNLDKKKTSIIIPDYIMINGVKCKVTSIEKKALYKGKKLKKITIGKNVQIIADNAFNGCKNLKSITIKSTVLKKVGKNAIKGIHKKATIKVPKKQYKQYKKLFSKKTGFKKSMKIKK